MTESGRIQLNWRLITLALIVVAGAFIIRFALIVDRAYGDPQWYPQGGSDQLTYLEQARGLLAGTWPDEPYYFQPLIAYFSAGSLALLGDGVASIRIMLALLDSIATGFMIGAGWLITRRWWGGYLAGVVWAIYPVTVFFATTLLSATLAASLLTIIFFFWLWQRDELSVWRSLLLGMLFGFSVATRTNFLPIIGLYGLWLILMKLRFPVIVRHAVVAFISMAAVVAPFTLWNAYATGGDFILINTSGGQLLFMGNARDSAGSYDAFMPSEQARETGWIEAMIRDIEVDPVRWVSLLGRKFAAFFGAGEPANNIDFHSMEEIYTRVLRVLPDLNHHILSWFALFGLAALWYRDRALAITLGLWVGLFLAVTVVFAIFGRLRFPVVVTYVLLGAYFVRYVADNIQANTWRRMGRQLAIPALMIVPVLLFPHWALGGNPPPLPIKRTYAELPDDAIRVDATFSDAITLVGWRPLTRWWPASEQGWLYPRQAYTVELFWTVNEPVDEDYNFYMAYVQDGERIVALDREIGAVSYPAKPSTLWNAGEIYGEIASIRIDDAELASVGQVQVGVYHWGGENDAFIRNDRLTAPADASNLTLQTLAVYDPAEVGQYEAAADPYFAFGDEETGILYLTMFQLHEQGIVGETLLLYFEWLALTEIQRDYTVFVHVMTADDTELAVQGGGALDAWQMPTSNWHPGVPFSNQIGITMPDEAGTYRVYIGVIDALTGDRLAVSAPDNRPFVGEIIVVE